MEEQNLTRVQRNQSKKKKNTKTEKKKKKSTGKYIGLTILAILVIVGGFQVPKLIGVFKTFSNKKLESASPNDKTISVLILGLDNDGGTSLENGHTDSITYVAANTDKKRSIALPIYRDANVNVACAPGVTENINRIYGQYGIECLAETVNDFLGVPLDYYAVITFDGFVEIVNEIGTLEITPKESFVSNAGQDKTVNYPFEAGVTTEMDADMLMAYLRYRGGGNGENRANRQVQLLQALKNKCMNSMFECYTDVSPHFPNALKTNVPITKMTSFSEIFGSSFDFETLEVINGTNENTENGWTQYVDEEDKMNKVNIIKEQIFLNE